MTHRVGPKGQVVIPKELRDALGIEPGDEISFWRDDDHVALRPVGRTRPLRGRFRGSHLVDELARERAADRDREDEAALTVRDLREVVDAKLPDVGIVLDAARIKSDWPMSYADAFAAALAVAQGAELWTGDPELLIDGAAWQWRDLRA